MYSLSPKILQVCLETQSSGSGPLSLPSLLKSEVSPKTTQNPKLDTPEPLNPSPPKQPHSQTLQEPLKEPLKYQAKP